ncbi:hypothetical protein Tco_1005445 [Tanacetum coccineum]|uniref:Uncharacterized protein n=1 Tax=Tanacetum coccineum TaxID=301880 RepID=A0ABQ5FH77_9ASTR
MDNPNITMEEYIRPKEEKARRHGQMFNWKTATFGKVENYEDEDICFIDFETEFPAMVFDNTLTAIPSEPTVYLEIKHLASSECIDEFNLIDKASLSEYDEEVVSRFNDLFNDIHPDDLKSEKDNDDNNIGIIQSSEDNEITRGKIDMAPLPAADQRHPWLRYQIEEYTDGVRRSYKQRLETIWGRPVNRVHVLDFAGLTPEIRQDLAVRLRMVYSVGSVRRRMMWRQFILALGLHTEQEMAEARFKAYWAGRDRLIPDKGGLRDYWMEISSDKDFLGPAPSYVHIQKPVRILCYRMIPYSISGRGRHAEGKKSGARLLGGHFIGCLAMHFGLVSDKGLRGLQQAVAAGAPEADEAGQAAKEVAQEIPVPALAQAPPPPAP